MCVCIRVFCGVENNFVFHMQPQQLMAGKVIIFQGVRVCDVTDSSPLSVLVLESGTSLLQLRFPV